MGMISVSCSVCMLDDVVVVGDVSIITWDNVLEKLPRYVEPGCFVCSECLFFFF